MAEPRTGRYSGCTRQELIECLDQLHGAHNAVLHEMLLVIAEMERQGVHSQDGQRTMASWLRLHLGLGYGTARRWDQMSSKVEELPLVAETFAHGRISFDKLVECGRLATADNEEDVVKEAVEGSISTLEAKAHAKRVVCDDKEEQQRAKKHVRFFWRDNGTRLEMITSLPAHEGAEVRSALERKADSYPLRDEEGYIRARDERCAQALIDLAKATIADDHDPDRATVVVGIEAVDLVTGGAGEESRGAIFSSDVMRHIACDARIQAVIKNRAGEIVDVHKTIRTASPAQRRAIMRRDRGCRFSGCGTRTFVEIHHILHWIDGGRTIIPNLIALCPGHHRFVHKKKLMIKGDPNDEVEFVDSDGSPIRAGPDPLSDWVSRRLWDDILGQDFGTSEEHDKNRELVLT